MEYTKSKNIMCTICGGVRKRACALNAATPSIVCYDCGAEFVNNKWTNTVCAICPHRIPGIVCDKARKHDADEVTEKIMCHWSYPFANDPYGF